MLADASTSTEDIPRAPLEISSEGPSTPLESPSLDMLHSAQRFEEAQSTAAVPASSPLRSTQESPIVQSSEVAHSTPQLPSSESAAQTGVGYQSITLLASAQSLPADVVRTINNINDLIASFGEEKNAMVKALKAESKGAAELRALNADLSRKLAATTQQLELVVSQRMAEGSSSNGLATSRNSSAALAYVDEGDEVVDRVFTWIMQLFPSRSARRSNGVKRL